MIKRKIFLSGKMTGIENYNRPMFYQTQLELEEQGFIVINPAILPEGLEVQDYRRICKEMIRACDYVLLLKGWETSEGANAEIDMARDLGKKVFLHRIEEEVCMNVS